MARHTKTLARSFAGGEMSPEMYSRPDDVMFQAGAETLLNCIPRPTGTVARRPGTRLIRETRESGVAHLFSFVFSPTQSTVIEGGRAEIGGLDSGYFRFHTNGGTLLYPQPTRYRAPLNTNGANLTFIPSRTVTCTVSSATFGLVAHGLAADQIVQFRGTDRTIPGGFLPATDYYVINPNADDFELSLTSSPGSAITVTGHAGYFPVLYNWAAWRSVNTAEQSIVISEHRIENEEPVVITMWPDMGANGNPVVTFHNTATSTDRSSFTAAASGTGPDPGLATTSTCAQQVLFVPDTGGVLPSRIEEGRLYWVVSYGNGVTGWQISKTFGGPPLNMGDGDTGTVRMCAMPETLAGSLGHQGELRAMTKLYAIADAAQPNILKLETTVAQGQQAGGGLSFTSTAQGCGPFKVHHAPDIGDIHSYVDAAGGVLCFYSQKNWWHPEFTYDQNVITEEIHTSPGPRTPGSGQRQYLTQGAYWREMAGRTTGDSFTVTPNEYSDGVDLVLTAPHGLEDGMQVTFVEGEMPECTTAVAIGTAYYVVESDSSSFKIEASVGGGAIVFDSTQVRQHGGLVMRASVIFSATLDVVWPAHGLSNGDTIVFDEISESTSQTNLTAGTVYYVRDALTDSFSISASAVGVLIDLSDADGLLVGALGNSIYEVPHDYTEDELPEVGTTQSGDVMTLVSRDHPSIELRRVSATKWEVIETEFAASIAPPGGSYEVLTVQGKGFQIVRAQGAAARDYFHTAQAHTLQAGTGVYVDGLPVSGQPGHLADGYYICGEGTGVGAKTEVYLEDVESGNTAQHGGDTGTTLDGRLRLGTQGEDRTQTYVVTAIDKNNEETIANDPLEVDANLFVEGASATIGWGSSYGAVRYRVYKKISGLYGMIGETDELEFTDDNIGPDLAVAPPIRDMALREHARVTFDTTADAVLWEDHGLEDNMPVVFRTSDRLPGVNEGQTYYVLNAGEDDFQVAATLDGNAVDITGTDTGHHSAISGNFPSTASYFEGRRVFGGSRAQPQDIWMTASGTESDLTYSIPTVDSDRIYFRIASREISSVRHLIPLQQLVLLSDSTEYRLTPVNDEALTPSSISVRPQSFVGAGYAQPSLVNNTVVFAAARGGHMRELGYNRDVLGYLTGDLSIRAAHLFDGYTIADQAYSKAPLPVVWCVSSSGKLLGITYIPEESIGAWHQHTTPDGLFESVAVVPEGDEDAIYVIVNRGGSRYVERFADEFRGDTADLPAAYFVDCGLTYDGAATTSIAGLDHLDGETVKYLADGVAGSGTVASGTLTLSTAASVVHVGLGFTTTIKTLPLSMMKVDAFGTGRQKNVTQVWVRVFQSGAFETGPSADDLVPSLSPASGVLVDDLVQVTLPGSWDDDGQILVQQDTPLPLSVSGLTIEVASGG